MRIVFKNFLDTINSFIRNDATAARTYQFPDKDITVAGIDDVETVPTEPLNDSAATINLDETAWGKEHDCSGTTQDVTVNLPTAVGYEGKTMAFKGLAALTKIFTLTGNSGQTMDGDSSRALTSRGIIVLKSDGVNLVV